jgi:hypothetical protein
LNVKIFSFILLFLSSFISLAHTCTDDAEEMTKEIRIHHFVYTKNHWKVLEIFLEREVDGDMCEADCSDYYIAFKCVWAKGDWINTLMAY